MSVRGAQIGFWSYAAAMGLSLSYLFLLYTQASIARTFFITAGMFGGMSLYGYSTKRDLSGLGSLFGMAVWGIILGSIVNIFLKSAGVDFALSIIGVLAFTVLTAVNTQQLKTIYYQVAGNTQAAAKASIYGALQLYLDFINIFLFLMRLFGERR